MSFPFFDRDRDNAGKQAAKRLKDRIDNDTSSFRTVIEKNIATGEETMLRTKGGHPEITKTPGKKPPAQEVGDRTFVFKIAGASTAVVANKAGGGLARIGAPFLAGMASYFVAAWKRAANIKWLDVIRLDNPDAAGDCDVILNHAAFTEQATTTATHAPSGVPYVHRINGAYAAASPTAPTQSLLYIGRMSNAGKGVFAVLKTGEAGLAVGVSDPAMAVIGHSANVRVQPDGTFLFYGGQVSYNIYDHLLWVATTTWSRIKTSVAAPYIVEDAHGAMGTALLGEKAVVSAYPDGYTLSAGTVTYPGPMPMERPYGTPAGGSYSAKATGHSAVNYGQRSEAVVDDYAYAGSDIQMKFTATVDVVSWSDVSTYDMGVSTYATYDYTDQEGNPVSAVALSGPGYAMVEHDANIGYRLEIPRPGMKALTDVAWSRQVSYRTWPSGALIDPQASRYDITRFQVETVDYLYADLDEDVYVTLEASIYRYHAWTKRSSGSNDIDLNDEYGYRARYVVSVRGVETEFPIPFDLSSGFAAPWMPEQALFGSSGIYGLETRPLSHCHMGYKPTPIFNPAYMSQGNCPFIAYTTKAEEAQGVPHEFYLDMAVFLNRFGSAPMSADGDRYGGVVVFTPMQFIKAYYQFIQVESGAGILQNPTAWTDHLFPPGKTTYRIQLCNGGKGPWADALGAEFSGNPQLNISRI